MPVSSFAPEFLELFKMAAQKEVILPLGNIKRATRLRFRLNMLRKAMRKEGHSLTTIANSVQFILTKAGDLQCSPADDQFLSTLQEAGIKLPPHPPTGAALAKPERSEAEEVIRTFFKGEKD